MDPIKKPTKAAIEAALSAYYGEVDDFVYGFPYSLPQCHSGRFTSVVGIKERELIELNHKNSYTIFIDALTRGYGIRSQRPQSRRENYQQ